jgi:hypothetical protein
MLKRPVRPEIGSREHILLFLASQPEDEPVDYMSPRQSNEG